MNLLRKRKKINLETLLAVDKCWKCCSVSIFVDSRNNPDLTKLKLWVNKLNFQDFEGIKGRYLLKTDNSVKRSKS